MGAAPGALVGGDIVVNRLQFTKAFGDANPWAEHSEYGHVVVSDLNIDDYWILSAVKNLAEVMVVMAKSEDGVEQGWYDLLYFYIEALKLPLPEDWDE